MATQGKIIYRVGPNKDAHFTGLLAIVLNTVSAFRYETIKVLINLDTSGASVIKILRA